MGKGLGWVTHRGPCQPRTFCDSVKGAEEGKGFHYLQFIISTRDDGERLQKWMAMAAIISNDKTTLQQPSPERETDGAVAASPKINASETTDLIPFKAVNAATVTNPEAWSDLGTACFHAITLTMPTHQRED